MKKYNLSQKFRSLTLEEIRFFVLCSFVFSLPFDRLYSQLLIIILLLLAIIDIDLKKIKSIPKTFWIFQSFFLITVVGLLNTPDTVLKDGMFVMEKQLAILLMPLLIPMSITINKHRVEMVFKTFTWATVISIVYLIVAKTYEYYTLDTSLQKYINSGLLFSHSFSSPLNMHAGYLSMFLTLAFFYVLKQLNIGNQENRTLLFLQLGILILGIIMLASRSNIFVIIVVVLFVFPFYIRKNIKKKILSILLTLTIIVSALYFSPYLNNRFSVQLLSEVASSDNQVQVEPRIVRWKEAIHAIQDAPIVGHGTGSESMKLKERYWESGLIHSFYQNYNSHNQYISITLKHGLVGLVLFLLALSFYFKIAFKSKSFIYLAFLIQIASVFLIENVLDVNKGIFYFAFFNTFLGYYNLNKKNESTNISNNSIL